MVTQIQAGYKEINEEENPVCYNFTSGFSSDLTFVLCPYAGSCDVLCHLREFV